MISAYLRDHAAYQYAIQVTEDKVVAGKYIKKACQQFLDDIYDEDCEYFIDEDFLKKVTKLTKLMNMPSGLRAGQTVQESLAPFQWFFVVNALCWKNKNDNEKRRFEKGVLLIARKSGKSFIIALIFLILLLLEPEYSEFYSVAPDKELSSIVKKETEQLIEKSPLLEKHFAITRTEVRCLLTKSKFTPLANSENRMDGRKASVFVADEVGALPKRKPIDSMQNSQMGIKNRLGILISTAYDSFHNPMIEEVEYSKKVLDGVIEDKEHFSMLYMPDNNKDWFSDKSLLESNPLATEIKDNYDYLVKLRQQAMSYGGDKKKEFLTKNLNIFVDGSDAEVYIPTDDLRKCKIDSYDWRGRNVYVGVDLSETTDNTGVAMITYDEDKDEYVSTAWAFLPEDMAEEKTKIEKVDYFRMRDNGYAFLCGDRVVDYKFLEDFVMGLEDKYGVHLLGIAYDPWNGASSAAKWSDAGYNTIKIPQKGQFLHPASKLVKERVLKQSFKYVKNQLLEINFANSREFLDTNNNAHVAKKKSVGRIDMVAAILDAMVMWNKDVEENGESAYKNRGILIL